jgi:hypothetical protein
MAFMERIYDLLALLALTAVAGLASTTLDPVGAEARRELTDDKLAAFLDEAPVP